MTALNNPEVKAAPTMNLQQANAIKQAAYNAFNQAYGEFISKISQFPAHQPSLVEAFKFFDTGYLWFEKAILNMPLNIQPPTPPQPQAPDEPAQEEDKESTTEANKVNKEAPPAA